MSLVHVRSWHIAAPDVCDGTSAVGKSRLSTSQPHPLVKPTEPCLAAVLAGRALAAKVTRPGQANPPSPIGFGCADIGNAITPRCAVASFPPLCDPSDALV